MTRPTFMQINLDAIRHNLDRVKAFAPRSSVMAMVKANAYGHGLQRVAHALSAADALGVASIEEALLLREAKITQPIVLMEGLFSPDEIQEVVNNHFSVVVHHWPQVEILEKADVSEPINVWLKINTGMHRLGIAPEDLKPIYHRLEALLFIQKPIGLMTHFAEADVMGGAATKQQIDRFRQLTNGLPGARSLVNSAGILGWQEAHDDWVRPGLMLYGASPFSDKTGMDFGLQPVMTMWSRIIAVIPVRKGGKVGYGGTFTAEEDMLVGVVGAGYGDGYPQFTKNGAPVLVNGSECHLAGRVSMDMLTVDLRNCPDAGIGDKVILWGEGLPVERVAQAANTSAYEILTRVTARPKIVVVG